MDIQRISLKKNIVILGAGFAGIACALRLHALLRRTNSIVQEFHIVLIDKNNYHLYVPNIYEVATSAAEDASPFGLKKAAGIPIEEIISGTTISFMQGKITHIDLALKKIQCNDHTSLPYEYLVFALGSEPAYFGIPGMQEHAISLKTLEDAIRIRSVVRQKYNLKQNGEALRVIIGGGGLTGAEVSCELVGYIKKLNRKLGKNIQTDITIMEGSPRLFPGFTDYVVDKASRRIASLGIAVATDRRITRLDETSVFFRHASAATDMPEQSEPYDVFVWAGGVQANSILLEDPLRKEKGGRIEIDRFAKCISPNKHLDVASRVFAVGDNACFYHPVSGVPAPRMARIAIEQAKVAAENIYCDILGKPKKTYVLKNYPYVIPLGGKYAIAKIGPLYISGFLGWAFKQIVELYYFSLVLHPFRALVLWMHGLELFSKND